ncbi:MAG: hypothetical protein HC821_02435, partial [Lewinella sp.]|nr:hypothetical protein [Lewinella sp.]
YVVQYLRERMAVASSASWPQPSLGGAKATDFSPRPPKANTSVSHQKNSLNDAYAAYLSQALHRLFAVDQLLPLMQQNSRITEQIVLDTLYWLRKTFTKVLTQHPYTDELERLNSWSVTPWADFRRRYPFLITYLRQTYAPHELDPAFYENRFQRYLSSDLLSTPERAQFELVLNDLLSQWDAQLQVKILAYQLSHLADEEHQYLDLVSAKVTEFRRLYSVLSPVTDYLGWDLSRELWQNSSLDLLLHYDELLQDESSLAETG